MGVGLPIRCDKLERKAWGGVLFAAPGNELPVRRYLLHQPGVALYLKADNSALQFRGEMESFTRGVSRRGSTDAVAFSLFFFRNQEPDVCIVCKGNEGKLGDFLSDAVNDETDQPILTDSPFDIYFGHTTQIFDLSFFQRTLLRLG